jgi:nitrite reductase/ring-hydroxylating ferredoxin subunit
MTDFIDAGLADRVSPGTAVVVAGACGPVALFNVRGTIFAVDDSCVRCGSSLARGALSGSDVSCPGCGWRYDVVTGSVNGIPALQIDTFEVRVVGTHVMIATTLAPHDFRRQTRS